MYNILNNTFATCYFLIFIQIEDESIPFSCHLHDMSIYGPTNITVVRSRQVLKLVPEFFIRGKHTYVKLILMPKLSPGSDECVCSFGTSFVSESVRFDNTSNIICSFPQADSFSENVLFPLFVTCSGVIVAESTITMLDAPFIIDSQVRPISAVNGLASFAVSWIQGDRYKCCIY